MPYIWTEEYKFELGKTTKQIGIASTIIGQIELVRINFIRELLKFSITYMRTNGIAPNFDELRKQITKAKASILGLEDVPSLSLENITRQFSKRNHMSSKKMHVKDLIANYKRILHAKPKYHPSILYPVSNRAIDWEMETVRLPKTGKREPRTNLLDRLNHPVKAVKLPIAPPPLEDDQESVVAMVLTFLRRKGMYTTEWSVKWKIKLCA